MSRREYKYVNSSNIQGVHYDPESRELHVQFVTGAEYRYDDVDPEDGEGLLNAQSPGSFLHENIKGQYNATRV